MSSPADRSDQANTQALAGTVAVILSTVLMLEMTRVFASYLVFVVDQSRRVEISLIVLLVFVSPVLAGLIVRLLGLSLTVRTSAIGLAALALLLQFIETPEARIAIAGLAFACWGWLTVSLLGSRQRDVAIGLTLGLSLDVAIRIAFQLIDLPWMPDTLTLIATGLIAAGLVFSLSILGNVAVSVRPGFVGALPLLAIGPGLAIFHLVTGNVALASVRADLSFPIAALQVASGLIAGIALIWFRVSRLDSEHQPKLARPRYLALDMLFGSIGLFIFWSISGFELLGLLLVIVASITLLTFTILPSGPREKAGIQPIATLFAVGLVVQFVILFLYYTSTGSEIMVAVAWTLLLLGAGSNIFRISRSSSTTAERPSLALPAAFIAVVLLAASVVQILTWSAEASAEPSGETITVMSYNIQSGFSLDNNWDLEAIAQTIEAADPDIVILQEVSRGWLVTTYNEEMLWLSERLGMPYVWGPASKDDLWGNAILSKWPASNEIVFKYASTQNLDRSLVSADIETPGGPVLVIGTHLDNPEEAAAVRFEQVDQLLEFWDGRSRTIIAGDFNADPNDPVIEKMLEAELIDTGADFGSDVATSYTGSRIDYIFVTPDFSVLEAEIPDSDASDHKPVVATLSLPE